MFLNCTEMITIDFSMSDNAILDDMRYMFCGCENLETIDISTLSLKECKIPEEDITDDTPQYVDGEYYYADFMFDGCENLETVKILSPMSSDEDFSDTILQQLNYTKFADGRGETVIFDNDNGIFTIKDAE